ncbi:PA14 domain-containing protein [Streptomyces sp. NPDC050504]|uniref:PA14 domain-containing protein n=1 Tax=Streptomyces sp. NPDC050504 TaxID=3365618 RepID=UPI00379A1829
MARTLGIRAATGVTSMAVAVTLLGAEPIAAAPHGAAVHAVRTLSSPPGQPFAPVRQGDRGDLGAARSSGAGPADGAVLADDRPVLAARRAAGAAAYEFVVGTGDSPATGRTASSGWTSRPAWRAPAGTLRTKERYTWTYRTRDGSGRAGTYAPARSFTVDLRLGAQPGGPVPLDSLGPVSVDLATGNVSASVSTPQTNTSAGPVGATFRYDSRAVGATGLSAAYFAGDSATGIGGTERPAAERTDPQLSFAWGAAAPYPGAEPGAAFRARWSGRLQVPDTGRYRLGATYDEGLRIWLDGALVLDRWQRPARGAARPALAPETVLEAGRSYALRVEYRRSAPGGGAVLWARRAGDAGGPVPPSWLTPSGAVLPPGWSVTPGASAPEADAGTDAGTGTAPVAGAVPAPAPLALPRTAGTRTAGTRTAGTRTAGAAAPGGGAAQLKALADDGLRFFHAGSPRCADATAPAGYVCAVSVPGAGLTRLVYANGKLARVVNPGDETTDFGFTADHRLTGVRTPLVVDWIAVDPERRDTEVVRYRIDYAGASARAASVTGPEPGGHAAVPTLRARHDYAYAPGRTEVTVAGVSTPRGWARRTTQDAAGTLLTDTDGTGRTVRTTWTATGAPASVTDAGGRTSTTVYDPATGMPSGSYGPGPRRCFGSDLRPLDPAPAGCGRVPARTTAYAPDGITTVRADSDGVPARKSLVRLDGLGLPVADVVDPDGLDLRTTSTYDSANRLTGKVLPNGAEQKLSYFGDDESADNPCTEEHDPAPQRGLWKTVTLPTPAHGPGRVNKNVYNARGVPVAQNTGADGWICLTYDARGRTTQMRMPKTPALPARTVDYDYAFGGDPLTLRGSEPTDRVTRTVDLLGRQVRFTDAHGTVTRTAYDRAGRAVEERVTPPDAADRTQVKRTGYDAAGRVAEVSLDGRTLAVAGYDAAGGLATVRYGNGTGLTVSRDPAGRITAKKWRMSDGREVASEVVRSRSGTVVDEVTAGEDPGEGRPNYRYDGAGRLVEAAVTGHVYGYDFTSRSPADCPAGTLPGAGSNGNRVRLLDRTASGTEVTGYCYDADDRILAATGSRPLSGFAYAPSGNLSEYVEGAAGTEGAVKVTRRYDFTERYLGGSERGTEVTYLQGLGDSLIRRDVTEGTRHETLLYGQSALSDLDHDLVLRADKRLLTHTVELPGGVVHIADGTVHRGRAAWNYPTVRGDLFLVADRDGRQSGDVYRYTPYGEPLAADGTVDTDLVPDNQPGDLDYGWLGQYRRGYEHAGSFAAVVLELRTLNTRFDRFEVGFWQGQFLNSYEYAYGDPVNHVSLNGIFLKPADGE